MPGYATWQTLYKEEYAQLFEEGYPVGECPKPDITSEFLPFPEDVRGKLVEDSIGESEWERAYRNLRAVMNKGIREDYPYTEPNGFEEIIESAASVPVLEPVNENEYAERVRGAWYGRCGGVILGKPVEMGWSRLEIEEYLKSVDSYPLNDWIPIKSEKLNKTLRMDCLASSRGHIEYAQPDDDIHYTILALLLAEKKGSSFTPYDVGVNWLDNIPYHWLWCSSRQAYYNMVNLSADRSADEQAAEFPDKLNPWRECIDGQLRGDFWGYINPAKPHDAACFAHRECSLGLVKNGLYGGMFVAGCCAAAMSKNPTVEIILQGGLSVIPKKSRLAAMVSNVVEWYKNSGDWIAVCDKIYEAYGHLPFAATINNMAIVVLALLHGGLDYTKTIATAVMCGIDTDCNSGTAASIVGAAVGYKSLDQRWIAPLGDKVKTAIAQFGEGTISDLVRRTIETKLRWSI